MSHIHSDDSHSLWWLTGPTVTQSLWWLNIYSYDHFDDSHLFPHHSDDSVTLVTEVSLRWHNQSLRRFSHSCDSHSLWWLTLTYDDSHSHWWLIFTPVTHFHFDDSHSDDHIDDSVILMTHSYSDDSQSLRWLTLVPTTQRVTKVTHSHFSYLHGVTLVTDIHSRNSKVTY